MMDRASLEIWKFVSIDMEADCLYRLIHSSDAIDVVEIVVNIDVEWYIVINE
jgi:hypothetical protein